MNQHIDLTAIVLLIVGCGAVYIAYRNPRLGVAIGIGVGVIGLLCVLLRY